jgi:hypothetical protein
VHALFEGPDEAKLSRWRKAALTCAIVGLPVFAVGIALVSDNPDQAIIFIVIGALLLVGSFFLAIGNGPRSRVITSAVSIALYALILAAGVAGLINGHPPGWIAIGIVTPIIALRIYLIRLEYFVRRRAVATVPATDPES